MEEVNRVLLEADEPPKNLGWSAFEGTDRVGGHELDREGELVWPVATYSHDDGCSITGGPVYGGARLLEVLSRERDANADFDLDTEVANGGLDRILKKVGEEAAEVIRTALEEMLTQ